MIEATRQKPVPDEYTALGFVRRTRHHCMDVVEDRKDMRKLQRIARGELCCSSLDREEYVHLKIGVPDLIVNMRRQSTGQRITWYSYWWRPEDPGVYSAEGPWPSEAISLSEATKPWQPTEHAE